MFRVRAAAVVLLVVTASCSGAGVSTTLPPDAPLSTSTTSTIAPDPLLLAIEDLTAVTEDIRQLQFVAPPNVVLVTEAELAERVRTLIEDELDPNETRRDELLLVALGLIGAATDLADLYTDLYSEQVAGFYDGETGELVVPFGDGALSQLQRLTLVHELTHALTDQHFGFADLIIDLDEAQRFEEMAAFTAVIEGDATLTETLYLGSRSRDDQLEVLDAAMEIETGVFDRTPRFIQELLLFPYTTGSDFVTAVWEVDGFEAVNDLYSAAPTTTEQIYHPADFMVGEPPKEVETDNFVPAGYGISETSVWGQAAFRAMFGQALDDQTATAAAVGWGGDEYRLLWDGGGEIVFDLAYVADSSVDATEMFETLVAFVVQQIAGEVVDTDDGYLEVAGEDFAVVRLDGPTIRFVVATDPEVGEGFVEQLLP
ncbi:MAG: hypothetical protein P1T08_11625 [Acidimicrobiia bacterium]|nr:hypothetical protein [Acidimicrobiia bacterium]